jgi:antitoxin HicB
MRYPVKLNAAEEGGFVVSFPDIPEAITQGDNREEALAMGLDALVTALDFYFDDRRSVPSPSPVKRGGDYVELPASVVAKVLLLNEMVSGHVRPIDLAKRLGVRKQEVTRLLDLNHATKIDSVALALKVLGKDLQLHAV